MKKKLALVLIIALSVMGITACGSASKTETPDTGGNTQQESTSSDDGEKALTVAWWGNQVRNDRTVETLDLYTDENPNVIFDGQFSEWGDYWNKLAVASAGGNLPDIVQMDYKYLEQYVSNDLLVDLTPYIDSGILDVSGIDQGILESGSDGDGVYAIALGVNAPSLLYNKTLLEENNIEIKDNMTMDEFKELSREVYEKTGYKTDLSYGHGENFIEYYMRAENVVLFDGDKLGVDSAEDLVPFFKHYEQGIAEGWHIAPSVFAGVSPAIEQSPIVYGTSPEARSWCAFGYSNQATATANAAEEGVEIGITTWPSNDPALSNYLKPSQFFSVTKHSKNPEEAAKIVDFFTNSVEANEILLGERGVPAAAPVAASIASQLSETETMVVGYINNVVAQNSSTLNPPASDRASEVFDLIDRLQEKLCYEQITSEEAAKELFEEGNRMLSGQ